MDFLTGMITNPVLVSAVLGWLCAQGLKIIGEIVKGDFSIERLKGGGGMPSAHSATVMGLTTGAAVTYGSHSFEFAMALFFAIIVMYDAMGVRYETGQEAKVLNRLDRERRAKAAGAAAAGASAAGAAAGPGIAASTGAAEEPLLEKPLDEKMGHTFPEIAAGFVIGILAGLIVCHFLH